MKLLHDYIHDPLKQTKRTLWCFARLTINSVSGCFRRFSGKFLKQMERLKRHSYFPGWKIPDGNSDFMSSNLFWILVSGFRSRFSLNETGLGKYKRDYRTESKFISPEFCSPFAQTVKRPVYPYVKSIKSLCPRACDTASSHRSGHFFKERWEASRS